MNLNYQAGSSPLAARQNFPLASFIIAGAVILAIILAVAFIYKTITNYKNSEKYKQAQQSRPTKFSDVVKFGKAINFSQEEISTLWNVCKLTKINNINYNLKDNNEVYNFFRSGFEEMKKGKKPSEVELFKFFQVFFQVEKAIAQTKFVTSTRFIPLQTVVFYITDEGEQFPLRVNSNTKDSFSLEIPEFLDTERRRPKLLVRQRFTFKTTNGLSYNLISRIIRYEKDKEGKPSMIIAHSEDLQAQAQRNFKREFLKETCDFSSLKIKENKIDDEKYYVYSDNIYKGTLSNISAGGCCIQTKLPIKEKQYLTISIPNLGIEEKIVGIIRRTCRLPSGVFALHIQFLRISVESKNKIYALVYKFVL